MRAFFKSAAAAAAALSFALAAPALAAPAARSLASRYAPRRAFGGARNHLLATPPQGWMSWERFRCGSTNGPDDDCTDPLTTYCISSALVRGQAQAMVARGFAAAGYTLLSLDDCWMSGRNPAPDNQFIAWPEGFPNSTLASTAAFVHALGMQLGTYTAESTGTCCGHTASQDFEEVDAASFGKWGVDYVKVDGCNSNYSYYEIGYPRMGRALEASGRDIAYSCSWPDYSMSETGGNITSVDWTAVIVDAGCNQFRVSYDIDCDAASLFKVIDHFGDNGVDMAPIHGPGHWMDADQLILGNDCISHAEEQTQMALWCVMAQPLIVSADFRNMTAASAALLLNAAAITIDQDPLGIMGLRLEDSSSAPTQRWAKPLLGGDVAVALVNRHGGSVSCPAWNVSLDGFPQCCGGCCTGFANLTVEEAEAQCCASEECAGFSYDPVAKGGCFKTAPDCGFVNSTQYQGYFRANYPPPVPPPADIEIVFADVDLFGPVRVYDVFAQQVVGVFNGSFTARGVPFHGSAFLRLSSSAA